MTPIGLILSFLVHLRKVDGRIGEEIRLRLDETTISLTKGLLVKGGITGRPTTLCGTTHPTRGPDK